MHLRRYERNCIGIREHILVRVKTELCMCDWLGVNGVGVSRPSSKSQPIQSISILISCLVDESANELVSRKSR